MNLMEALYDKIEDEQLWERELSLHKGELLVKEGANDSNIYFIQSGTFRVYVWNEEEDLTIRFGYAQNFVAALDCFITGKPTILNIEALKRSEVLVISKSSFVSLCQRDADAMRLWDQILLAMVYQQMEREIDILITSPESRFQRVLERSPQLFQEIPGKYIASYLRMAPETYSRLKKS